MPISGPKSSSSFCRLGYDSLSYKSSASESPLTVEKFPPYEKKKRKVQIIRTNTFISRKYFFFSFFFLLIFLEKIPTALEPLLVCFSLAIQAKQYSRNLPWRSVHVRLIAGHVLGNIGNVLSSILLRKNVSGVKANDS